MSFAGVLRFRLLPLFCFVSLVLVYATPVAAHNPCPTATDPDPSVSLCAPLDGATVTSPVHILAGTTSTATVTYIEVWVDGVKQYHLNDDYLDIDLAMGNGTHRVTVQAYNGVVFKKTVNITVSGVAGGGGSCVPGTAVDPSVTICSPASGSSVASPVNVVAAANSSKAVSYLQVYLDGTKIYQTSGSTLNTNLVMAAGSHKLTVQGYNGVLFKTSETITVTSGTPSVSVTVSPASASVAVNATQQFTATVANASDTSVTWFVDGIQGGNAPVGSIDVSANPATYLAPAANGSHAVKAISNFDNTKSATATVTISGGTGGGICTPNTADSTVTICAPATDATVTSPVAISAVATSAAAVQFMQIYVDGVKQYQQNNTTNINTSLAISGGTHRLTVQAYNGTYFKSTENITVSSAPEVNVSVSPSSPSIAKSATQQFTATVINTSNTAIAWSVDGVAGGNATVGTIDASANLATYTAPATDSVHTIMATSQADTSKSGSATVTVGTPPVPAFKGMFTYKYDNARQGANMAETALTPSNVNSSNFGKKWAYTVDGYVYAMPLYVPGVNVGGTTRNVVYIATEHDTVYAFDADGSTTSPLWKKSFLSATATTIPQADVSSTIFPEIGITGTPVIDPASNTIYVVANTKESGAYFQRLHALDITTGNEKSGSPVDIKATVKGTGDGTDGSGNVAFQPKIQLQRPALTLYNGVVYIAWASHGDNGPYHGWVIGYDATTLAQVAVHNNSPNGRRGGIWMSGGGLAVDEVSGGLFYMSGNGTFTANTGGKEYGDSMIKLNASGAVTDYFTPFDQANMNMHDLDLGVGAPTVLPDQSGTHPHLVVGAGKTASIYLVDRDNMGHFNSASNNQIVQYLPNALTSHCHEQPVVWNGTVYFSTETGPMSAWNLSGGLLSTMPTSKTTNNFDFPGPNPVISANGNSDGILWAIDKPSTGGAVLRAYDAVNLATELYDSNQVSARDSLVTAVKFVPPLVANGHVYVVLKGQVAVFGLLK